MDLRLTLTGHAVAVGAWGTRRLRSQMLRDATRNFDEAKFTSTHSSYRKRADLF